MREDLLETLEYKVAAAMELIAKLRTQIENLEQDNLLLQIEQEKWRDDLTSLIGKFDSIEMVAKQGQEAVAGLKESA